MKKCNTNSRKLKRKRGIGNLKTKNEKSIIFSCTTLTPTQHNWGKFSAGKGQACKQFDNHEPR